MMMSEKQEKDTPFPWMETVIHSFEKSFISDYDINILAFLHRNIDSEIKFISNNGGKYYTVARAQALYIELTNLYEHMRLKISQRSDFPNATLSCVKLLSQIIKTGLVLTQGLKESKWIARCLTAIKFFTGKFDLIYDVLLLVNGLKKIYHKPYALLLKCVLIDDHHEYITTDPLVYMKIILLFRRLSALIMNRNHCITLITKIKPPSNLISWLLSLNVNNTSQLLKDLKYKRLAQQLIRKDLPEPLLQKIRDMALDPYYFDTFNDEYTIQERTEDPLDIFLIDSSSTFNSHSNKKKLKCLSKKKKPVLNQAPEENAKTEKSTVKADSHLSYINNYSNLVVELDDTEGVHESEASDTCLEYNSETDACRFVLPKSDRLSRKKQKLKVLHQIQNDELETKGIKEMIDSGDDSFCKNDIPPKKSKKDIPSDNFSPSNISLKRSVNKNTDITEGVVKKDANVKSRKKLKSCLDRKSKLADSNFASARNTKSCLSENRSELYGKQNNLSESDEISNVAEIPKSKSSSNQQNCKKSLKNKKEKTSRKFDSSCRAAVASKICKTTKREGYSSDVTDKHRDKYLKNVLLKEKKSVSQTSSPVKTLKNNELRIKESLKNKRPKSSGESDSACKIELSSKKKIIKTMQNENYSFDITDEYKREYFRNLSLKKKNSAEISLPIKLSKDSENLMEPPIQHYKISKKLSEDKAEINVELLGAASKTSKSKPSHLSNIESSCIETMSSEYTDSIKNTAEDEFPEQNSVCGNALNANNLKDGCKKVFKSSSILSLGKDNLVSEILTSHSLPDEVTDLKVSEINTSQKTAAINTAFESTQNTKSITLLQNIELHNEGTSTQVDDSSSFSNTSQNSEENTILPPENLNSKNKSDINCEEYAKKHSKKFILASSENNEQSVHDNSQNEATPFSICNEVKISAQISSPHDEFTKRLDCVSSLSVNNSSRNTVGADEDTTELQISFTDNNTYSSAEPTTDSNSHSFKSNITKLENLSEDSKSDICSSKIEDQKTEEKIEVHAEDNSKIKKLKIMNCEKSSINVNETDTNQDLKNERENINVTSNLVIAISSNQLDMPFNNDAVTNFVSKIEDNCNLDKPNHNIVKDTECMLADSSDVVVSNIEKDYPLIKQVPLGTSSSPNSQRFESQKVEDLTIHCENYLDTKLEGSKTKSIIKSKNDSENTNETQSISHEDRVSQNENLNTHAFVAIGSSKRIDLCNVGVLRTCTLKEDVDHIKEGIMVKSENVTTFPNESKNNLSLKQAVCTDELNNQKTKEQIVPCDNSVMKLKENICEETDENVFEIKNTSHDESIGQNEENFNSCIIADISSDNSNLSCNDKSKILVSEDNNQMIVEQMVPSDNSNAKVLKENACEIKCINHECSGDQKEENYNSCITTDVSFDKSNSCSSDESKTLVTEDGNQMTDEQIVPSDNSDKKILKENVCEIKCTSHEDSVEKKNENYNSCVTADVSFDKSDLCSREEEIEPSDNSDVEAVKYICERTDENVCEIKNTSHDKSVDQNEENFNSCVISDISSHNSSLCCNDESKILVSKDNNQMIVEQMVPSDNSNAKILKENACKIKCINHVDSGDQNEENYNSCVTADVNFDKSNSFSNDESKTLSTEDDNQMIDEQMEPSDKSDVKMLKENNCERTDKNVCEIKCANYDDSVGQNEANYNSCVMADVRSDNSNLCSNIKSENLVAEDDNTCNVNQNNSSITTAELHVDSQNNEIIAGMGNISPSKQITHKKNSSSFASEPDIDRTKNNMDNTKELENQTNEEKIIVHCESNSNSQNSIAIETCDNSEKKNSEMTNTKEDSIYQSGNSNANSCFSLSEEKGECKLTADINFNETELSCNDTAPEKENIDNIKHLNIKNMLSDSKITSSEQNICTSKPGLHGLESGINRPEKASEKRNMNRDLNKDSPIATTVSSSELELCNNDVSIQLTDKDKNICNSVGLLELRKYNKNSSPRENVVSNSEFQDQKYNKKIMSCENTLNSKKTLTNKSLDTNDENLSKNLLITTVTNYTGTNLLDNSKNMDSSCIDSKMHATSQTNSEASYSGDDCNPSVEASNSEDGLTCDNIVSVIKENKPKYKKIFKQDVERGLLRQLLKIPTSEYIPRFFENDSYVTFSDISLRDKHRSIDVDSGLKSPITHFSSAASAEIFSMYRNDEERSETDLISRDDVLSNDPELSDETKSQSLSSDHSEEDCEFKHNFSDEEDHTNRIEMASDVCHSPSIINDPAIVLKNKSPSVNEQTSTASTTDSFSLEKDASCIGDSGDLNETQQVENTEEEVVKEVLPRQSLRLRNKAEVKSKSETENSQDNIPKLSNASQKELLETKSTDKCRHNSDDFIKSIKISPSSPKNVLDDFQTPLKTKKSSQKSVLKKSSLRNKSKVKSENCSTNSKVHSLRHSKSTRQKDDSPSLGIDLNKLQLDSPSSSRTTRSNRESKFVKILTFNIDTKNIDDSTMSPKLGTHLSVSKPEKEAVQSTPSYNLRNRKSIIAPAKLKI